MPHDQYGRKIGVGDIIKVKPSNTARTVIGHIQSMHESQSCTGKVGFPVIGGFESDYFDASRAELLLKADGSEPGAPSASNLDAAAAQASEQASNG